MIDNAIFILMTVIILGSGINKVIVHKKVGTFVATVESKDVIFEENSKPYYLIHTDKGSFKLENNLLAINFNAKNVYARIKQDSTYTFNIAFQRKTFYTAYPNYPIITNVK